MRNQYPHRPLSFLLALLALVAGALAASAGEFDNVPAKGMPTLVILGTPSCAPCVRMKPVIEKLAERYKGRAAVVPIDIGIHKGQIARFNVKATPVEVFFDAAGREVYRHLGYMDEGSFVEQFKKLGVE